MKLRAAIFILIGMASQAFASEGFDIVIPGRPGVPIIINGIDVSYAVVEGTYGLGKSYAPPLTIYGGRYVDDIPNVGHYFPSSGRLPGYGRLEIEPPTNRKLPPQAESFYQSWSAQSAPLPPDTGVPVNPPPVIYAPQNFYDQPPRFRGAPGRPHN